LQTYIPEIKLIRDQILINVGAYDPMCLKSDTKLKLFLDLLILSIRKNTMMLWPHRLLNVSEIILETRDARERSNIIWRLGRGFA